ncbi:hypothetical protein ABBQ38_15495 [Trebouxia sp. C0009 RCD-2024]
MMLGLVLGLFPQGDACSWDGITCEASRVVGMSLSGYGIPGTLPEAWAQLFKVTYFDLSNNQLTGSLPDSWQTWTDLEKMNLGMNSLNGSIPGSWGSLTKMGEFDLSANQLTGALPDSWQTWTNVNLWHQPTMQKHVLFARLLCSTMLHAFV